MCSSTYKLREREMGEILSAPKEEKIVQVGNEVFGGLRHNALPRQNSGAVKAWVSVAQSMFNKT